MKIQRLKRIALFFALAILFFNTRSQAQENASQFSRKGLYAAMATPSTSNVENQLTLLKNADVKEKTAYEGALIMRKASLVKGANKKLKLFKEGHKKLEAAISNDTGNVEYRFLRLMIQEHAPGMLGYKDDLDKDSTYIRQSFKKLPADVQQAITDYSKTSKVLRSDDF